MTTRARRPAAGTAPSPPLPPADLALRAELAEGLGFSTFFEAALDRIGSSAVAMSRSTSMAREGRYPYIALDRKAFLLGLLVVKRLLQEDNRAAPSLRFVDVGCGIGEKLVLAEAAGFVAEGVEVDPRLVRRARAIFGIRLAGARRPRESDASDAVSIHERDALGFSYRRFHAIYFYCPFIDKVKEARLEARIFKQARPGAYVIACSGVTTPGPEFRRIEVALPDYTPMRIFRCGRAT